MRSDLKAVEIVSDVQTDLDNQTCTFKLERSADVEALLNKLAKQNNKLADWTFRD